MAGLEGKLSRYASSCRKTLKIPGAVIGILHRGKPRVLSLGIGSIRNRVPVSKNTLFQIGSISKMMVAAVALRLCEKGKLALDRPVVRFLPELKLQDKKTQRGLTLRHLLTHTGGWEGDYFDDTGRGDDALGVMLGGLRHLRQQTPLGKVWAYNNSAFYIVGRLVEKAANMSLEGALAHELFIPEDVMTRDFSVGHHLVGGKARVAGSCCGRRPTGDSPKRILRPFRLPLRSDWLSAVQTGSSSETARRHQMDEDLRATSFESLTDALLVSVKNSGNPHLWDRDIPFDAKVLSAWAWPIPMALHD